MVTIFPFLSLLLYSVHGNVEDLVNYKMRKQEYDTSYWKNDSYHTLLEKRNYKFNDHKAENIIFFLGDGMSFSTLAATRSYYGEEGASLSFEKFPVSGLSKTYCVDAKVADSACSATAYLCGVKGNILTVGVNARVQKMDCDAMVNKANHVSSVAKWFQDAGCGSGVVTTTRVTHASPSGLYANSAYRQWENDANVASSGVDPEKCHDIAYQMVMGETGRNLKVIMGGGRDNFLPESEGGQRKDGRNLIRAWELDKIRRNKTYAYVTTKKEMRKVMSQTPLPDYFLGLFNKDHMSYHSENNLNEPSLSEMTSAAITLLSRKKCYFLMSEGGKIDMGHHENQANKAMTETKELSKAVEKARLATSEKNTLIIVTADHSHSMLYSGYVKREDSITGFAGEDMNGKLYRALSYSMGPGFRTNNEAEEDAEEDADDPDFRSEALRPHVVAAHDGSDVCVFCSGPQEHMCSGSHEQSYYGNLMGYVADVGDGPKLSDDSGPKYCDHCGFKLPATFGPKTCRNCGHKIVK